MYIVNEMDQTLHMGDHIFACRAKGPYAHHGIYVGEEHGVKYVIHFTSTVAKGREMAACQVCGYRGNVHLGVVKTCLYCFLSGDRLQVKNHRYPKPSDEVVETAFHLLNYGFGEYNLVSNNCEHFANFCKTGIRTSEQVEAAGNTLGKISEGTEEALRKVAIYSGVAAVCGTILLACIGSNSTKRY